MRSATSTISAILPDAFGLAMLGVQIVAIFYFLTLNHILSDDGSRLIFGILTYIVLAAVALYMWHGRSFTMKMSRPVEWAAAIGASIFLGALSFGADMLVGLIANPQLSPIEAGTKAGSPFGFALTVMLCPGVTTVTISGFFRALFIHNETTPWEQNDG
jgi:hypothetical protein